MNHAYQKWGEKKKRKGKAKRFVQSETIAENGEADFKQLTDAVSSRILSINDKKDSPGKSSIPLIGLEVVNTRDRGELV